MDPAGPRPERPAEPAPEATPAATVVLLRDGAPGLEVLMVRRSSRIAFAGMWAFPGGKVEPEDADPDLPDDELQTARRAAVRETAEEAGLAVEPGALVPFSHWTPPPISPRRFSTWFFLVPAPAAHEVLVDGLEIDDHQWLRPADALARRDAGEIELAAPTWVTLWRLAGVPSVALALEEARQAEPERFATRLVMVDDVRVALWHGDAGYTDGDVERAGPRHRLSMRPDGWRYVRSERTGGG